MELYFWKDVFFSVVSVFLGKLTVVPSEGVLYLVFDSPRWIEMVMVECVHEV